MRRRWPGARHDAPGRAVPLLDQRFEAVAAGRHPGLADRPGLVMGGGKGGIQLGKSAADGVGAAVDLPRSRGQRGRCNYQRRSCAACNGQQRSSYSHGFSSACARRAVCVRARHQKTRAHAVECSKASDSRLNRVGETDCLAPPSARPGDPAPGQWPQNQYPERTRDSARQAQCSDRREARSRSISSPPPIAALLTAASRGG